MNRRFLWLGVIAYLLSVSSILARTAVIKTKDGRVIEGEIVEEKPDQIIIAIKGIKTTIPRDSIVGDPQVFENIEARYQAKLAELPKTPSVKDRLELARFLYDHKAYDLALREVAEAQKLDPNSTEAATLEQTIMSQKRIERTKPPATGGNTTVKPPAGDAGKPAEHKFLTPADVNVIRQYEWQKTDQTVPRVTVPADVRRKFIDYKALDSGQFAALTPAEQAWTILDEGTAEMKAGVKITSDPQALADFRRTIQPLLVNNCATIGCHGGDKAGRFVLMNQNIDRDDVAYTNFYILNNFKQSIGDKEYAMIDRAYPDRSLLAYLALPPDLSEIDHPEVKGHVLKALVSGKNDQRYKALTTWMSNLVPGESRYGIKYTLPGAKPVEDKPKETPKQPEAEKQPVKPVTPTPTPNTSAPKPAAK